MQKSTRGRRRAVVAAAVSLLVMGPFAVLAEESTQPLGSQIVNRVFERLCARGVLKSPRCAPTPPAGSTLTLVKTVVNDDGGTAVAADFQAKVDGAGVSWGTAQAVSPGAHLASEMNVAGYTAGSWGGDCAADGSITLAAGEHKTCTITNNDDPQTPTMGQLVVDKVTQPSGSSATFTIAASGSGAITGGGEGSVTDAVDETYEVAPGTYDVAEVVPAGWMEVSNTCVDVVVASGETKTCTITNAKLPTLTLMKNVVNNDGGQATTTDFQAKIDGNNVPWGEAQTLSVGAHTASETTIADYSASSWSGDCAADGSITLAAGDVKTCTITNDDDPPQQGALLITEVLYDVGDGQGAESTNDWVEIHNGTTNEISLAGYFIHDASSADALPGITLQSGQLAIITNSTTTEDFWNIPDGVVIIALGSAIGNGLNNPGDVVWLEDASANMVDAVSWGSDTTAFTPAVPLSGDGSSLARFPMTTDTDSADDWVADPTPTPGS